LTIYEAPDYSYLINYSKSPSPNHIVFLAGSINSGSAVNWQPFIAKELDKTGKIDVLNPRRADWDSSWGNSASCSHFVEQSNWELDALHFSDTILMYFEPTSQSPITLLELGLFAKSKKLFVVCPDGFYRKGNVSVVCERYDIPMINTLEACIDLIISSV
jgi:hypothetical protein